MTGPRVLALVGDLTGPSLWRILWPLNALQAAGYQAWYLPLADPRLELAAARSDAVLIPRLTSQDTRYARLATWMTAARATGLRVLGDYDDDLFSPDCLPQTELMGRARGEDQASILRGRFERLAALRLLDGVTVANPRVAAVIQAYSGLPVQVVPNALDWDWWQARTAHLVRTDARLTIGWAGGRRLDADLAPMLAAWERLAADYPAVAFRIAGHCPDAVRAALPPDRLRVYPWLPLDAYPQAYAHVDIGCCPLADVPFNHAKTPIKAFEWGAVGAAVVASPTVYGAVLRDGRDGLLAADADGWYGALAALVTDGALSRRLARRWTARVRTRHSLARQLARWPAAWAQLLGEAAA